MIREKMFRLHRHKQSTKSAGERIDFNFSNIQALQVPKGWDRLYVSFLSTETGKTVNKSGKAYVRNGTCQWTETLSESIYISQDEAPKEFQQYLFKLVVAMGSARSSVLGEATINLAGYMSSRASIPLSLPLKKCNHGTVLQVEIQCLTPRIKHRDEKLNQTNSDGNSDYDDVENKSEVSDGTFTKSVGSSSSNHLDGTSHPGDLGSRETSFSASGSRYSFDSIEGSLGRESFSPQSNISGVVKHVIGRQDSGSGRHQHQREDSGQISHGTTASPLRNAGSSGNFLEAEVITMEELRVEARMWERNARKLMLDHELLMKEFADQSKQLANLDVELSASRTECDGFRQEIEYLKVLLDKSMDKQKAIENLKFQPKDMDNIQKVLEDEIKFQKESTHDLALQLKKTQDSNLELVSILQEMEETIEKQKEEIEKLATLKSKFDDTGKRCSFGHDDNGEVNANGEVSAKKMKKASCDSDLEGSTVEYPINDLHAGFEQEDNLNLEFQLEQLRESQKNLESTIVYLEKTLEDKNHEIVIEQELKTRALQDCEAEWRCKLAAKEEETIDLEAKLSKALSDKNSEVLKFDNRGDPNLIKEIDSLKEKVQELERDCNELTAENLELLLKLKEATKNLPTNGASCKSSPNKCPVDNPPVASEVEVSNFKYQMCQFEEEIKNDEIPIQGVADSNLPFKCVNVRNECTEMELQLQVFKGRGETTASKYHHPADVHTKCENSESQDAIDKFELHPALFEQLQLFFASVNKIQHTLNSHVDSKYTTATKNLHSSTCTELTSRKDLEEAVLDNLVQLNKLFEAKISLCEDDFPCGETAIRSRNATEDQNKLESDNLKENTLCAFCQVINGSIKELESTVADLSKELLAKTSLIEKLNADSVLKEEEIKASIRHQRDLETQISDLQKIKEQMEENMEIMQSECSITSKCLDSLKNDLTVQSSSMESHLSNKKVLERKSLELERTKCELELHLSELEEENVHLSGRISGLEAQLRYLTDAREASRLELQQSESHVMNLQDDIQRLEDEMEAHKVTMKQKTEDMQKRWLEVQEECEYLRKANPKLQETAENLIEECSLLQKSNHELRQQKIELQEYGTVLEMELKETRNKFSNCTESIEALEAKFSGILEETNSKERFLNSELDALRQHNKEWEKLVHAEGLFNQMNFEKAAEVENLQQEVADITGQNRSEASLQDFQGNFKLPQNKLENIQMDCQTNILALMTELAASKENHQILVGNHKKLLGLLEDVRSNEEKHKGTIDKLESKLKSSEYERLQLAEEISCLKIQLQKIQPLQEEVLALKGSLYGTRFENERLQNSLDLLSGDCEELKTERISLLQKISSMQNAMLDSENCKRSKVALEEKILRMEGDLTASDALCSQDAELKNELGRIRRVSSQFQWKIKCLEEEKEEWLQRARALEEEVKQKKEVKQEQVVSSSSLVLLDPGSHGTNESTDKEWMHSEKYEEADIVLINQDLSEQCTETGQLQHFSEGRGIVRHQRQDNDEQQHDNPATSPKLEVDTVSRIKVLENELAEALEANDMYKAQLKSLLSEGQICHSKSHKKLEVENPAIDKEENKYKADFLEAELREIQERYLEMSLKYAEVEAQREQLVMKLKTVNSGKRWFS